MRTMVMMKIVSAVEDNEVKEDNIIIITDEDDGEEGIYYEANIHERDY